MLKPYYQDDAVTIYHGDCREIVPTLGRFDLLLTDPPYGLGDRWTGGGTWQHHAGLYAQAKKWDQEAATAEQIMVLAERATVAIVWGGNYFGLPPSRGWLAWMKPQRMHTVADFELAWTNIDFPAKAFDALRNPDGRRQHPTQKPLTLMSWCIGQADRANGGDVQTILDPFAGSGTTGRAAKDLGRKAVLIEREERYCEIAASRMAQEVLPLEYRDNASGEGRGIPRTLDPIVGSSSEGK